MNRELTVQQVVSLLFRLTNARLQCRVVFKFQGFVALNANQVVVMVRIRAVDLVVLVPLSQLKLPQNSHSRHQFQSAIDGR